jgi:hypothetical protein
VAITVQRVTARGVKLKIMPYGVPGVGKTTFIGQANDHPDLSPVLVLNLEGGLLSLAARDDVDSIDIRSTAHFEEVFDAIANNEQGLGAYKTIAIDSGTELAKMSLGEWVHRNMDRQERKGKLDADRTRDDVEIQDYGKMTVEMRRLFGQYRHLDRHVIITAREKFVYPPGMDRTNLVPIECTPDFTTSLASSVMGMMDHVWFMYLEDEQAGTRAMLTRDWRNDAGTTYRGKTRGQFFAETIGPLVTSPYLPDLYETLVRVESGDVSPEVKERIAERTRQNEQARAELAESEDDTD